MYVGKHADEVETGKSNTPVQISKRKVYALIDNAITKTVGTRQLRLEEGWKHILKREAYGKLFLEILGYFE